MTAKALGKLWIFYICILLSSSDDESELDPLLSVF